MISIFLLLYLIVIFYALEESNARHYQIIKTFAGYTQEQSNGISASLLPDDFVNFIEGELGCLRDDGRVYFILSSRFADVFCSNFSLYKLDPESTTCDIPPNICNADASRIVKYTSTVNYDIGNYSNIAWKVLLIVLIWILLVHLLYYKALLYIIYGSSKKEKE